MIFSLRASASRIHASACVRSAGRQEHVHHLLVRAAVQPALQRPDGADDGRVQIGLRRADDAGGKGGGIEFMLGIQDERNVERLHFLGARQFPAQQVKHVGGMSQIRPRRDGRRRLARTIKLGNGDGDLPQEPLCLP